MTFGGSSRPRGWDVILAALMGSTRLSVKMVSYRAAAMRRILVGLVVLVVAGCSQPEAAASPVVVKKSVVEHALLNDALQIDFDRRHGSAQIYALVPATRPPGLLRMSPNGSHGDGGSFATTYQFGAQQLNAVVELSPRATEACELIKDGQLTPETLCVRDDEIAANPTGFTHVTVYFTGNVGARPETRDRETGEAAEFWARTEMVPIDQAHWFTDLLERGTAAAGRDEVP